MTIIHIINDLFFDLFPKGRASEESLLAAVSSYHTINGVSPTVSIVGNSVHVVFSVDTIEKESAKFKAIIKLCELGQFVKSKPLALALVTANPSVSEYHRVFGQILYELAEYDEALNAFIDALKWDSKNTSALTMMGNLQVQVYKDTTTAKLYYDAVLSNEPNNFLALNNIGALLLKSGDDSGLSYMTKSYEINPDFENTLYAFALYYYNEANFLLSFEWCTKLYKVCKPSSQLFDLGISLGLAVAKQVEQLPSTKDIIASYLRKVTLSCGKEIRQVEDETLTTAAKVEIAENHNRAYHLIKYKPSHAGVSHLIMHELVHLDFIAQARDIDDNKLFTTSDKQAETFNDAFKNGRSKLLKKGLSAEKVDGLYASIFSGICLQAYNTPIDIFIEDFLFKSYKDFRSVQFISLYSMLLESIHATTDKAIVTSFPPKIIDWSKSYNLINAYHFKALFHIDKVKLFKGAQQLVSQAATLYTEYKEYSTDRAPGEEYELVQNWGNDLGLSAYFTLSKEVLVPKGGSSDSILDEIEKDPYGLSNHDIDDEIAMQKFVLSHGGDDVNMAVVMYMVGAMKDYSPLSQDKIKEIAFELAQLGTTGIDPNKKGYKVSSFPGQSFSGYRLLAYYYVSWATALPEMLAQLQMPFDQEYSLATRFIKK